MALPSIRAHRALLSLLLWLPMGLAAQAGEVLTLGRISDNPKQHYAQLKPLLDYVVPRMAEVGIRRGRILMARDARQMANYLRRGRVDWVTETPGTATLLQDQVGAQALVLTERNGVRNYRSVIISHNDSGVAGLADLAGRGIAFEHLASTSAYLAPAAELLAQGLMLEPLISLDDTPTTGRVGYLFARSASNIALWVAKGLVAAGAISSLDWDDDDTMPISLRSQVRVVHQGMVLPRALELVRADLDPRVRARLQHLLLAAANDPEAAPALRQFFGTTAFLAVDPTMLERLDTLRAGVARVHVEVE